MGGEQPMGYHWRRRRGVTLTELVVTLLILGLVLTAVYQYFHVTQQGWERAAAASRTLDEARIAVMALDNEVRQARKAAEAHPSLVVSGTTLDVYTDVTGDGVPELVRYRLQGGQLERGVVAASGDEYPYTYGTDPADWVVVVTRVANAVGEPPFVLDSSNPPRLVLTVDLVVEDPNDRVDRSVRIQARVTVRSRGEAD